ncbi:copper resistance CopC family protein [Amycolatopsis taiwanensis]|uniref:Copper resistance protein C n=1 Tax=Amycolatopsis taiwanensis TaxID=342230 RepID=A0A9W6VE51_9PSEU|nr:copper resistance CopC family protein [Amycolatopsis taiwanensis]GLY64132.1 copper resistance protein C [Amycolatopsis taiwanensis]
MLRKILVTVALAALAMLGLATPALAHDVLLSTDPVKDASMETGPAKITLTFNAPVQGGDLNQIAVTGPNGTQWAEGSVSIDGNMVSAPVRPLGPAGVYTVGYRILSADGHPVQGQYTFTLTKAGNGTPAAAGGAAGGPTGAASSSGSGGVPVWVWVVGAVVLLAIGLTVALRMGRGRTP